MRKGQQPSAWPNCFFTHSNLISQLKSKREVKASITWITTDGNPSPVVLDDDEEDTNKDDGEDDSTKQRTKGKCNMYCSSTTTSTLQHSIYLCVFTASCSYLTVLIAE
jgi:hypothetical protein